jgi:hypothetical protein
MRYRDQKGDDWADIVDRRTSRGRRRKEKGEH